MLHRLITENPSRAVNRWQYQGGDLAILPVGSAEVLGPHLPLGGRGFVAEAFALLLAEAADGILLPGVPLSPLFGAASLPGGIDVSEPVTNDLTRAIMDDLVDTGFRRIVLVTWLEYAHYYLPTELWEDRAVAAVGVNLEEVLGPLMQAKKIRLDSVVLGALDVLGRSLLLAKCLEAAARFRDKKGASTPPSEAYLDLSKAGKVAVNFPQGHFACIPGDDLDPAAGAEVIREAVSAGAPSVAALRDYNAFLAKRGSRGFLRGSWFKDEPASGEAKS